MNTHAIERHFDQMGARITIRRPQPPSGGRALWWNPPGDYSLDVEHLRDGDRFVLTVPEAIEDRAEFTVLQSRPKDRHLLLMARRDEYSDIDRFLCGHDEREWFVAAVPGAVSTVAGAMESLKPASVIDAQARAGLGASRTSSRSSTALAASVSMCATATRAAFRRGAARRSSPAGARPRPGTGS